MTKETDGELISRDYAIEQIKKAQENGYVFTYDTLIDFVKVLPTIPQVECTEKPCLGKLCAYYTDGDLISRKAAIDTVMFECGEWTGLAKEISKQLRQLPSEEKTAEWIPISERLPKDRDWYLGIFKEPDTGWINPIPFICDYVGRETKATTKEYWILRGITDEDDCVDYYYNLECVAWMPLPEPYEES